jgi:hypothetical protein
MKTILLFSSVFYLLGLKLGNTIDLLKRVATPVKKVISAPALKPEPTGKSYFFKADGDSPKDQQSEKENDRKKDAEVREKNTPVKPG